MMEVPQQRSQEGRWKESEADPCAVLSLNPVGETSARDGTCKNQSLTADDSLIEFTASIGVRH